MGASAGGLEAFQSFFKEMPSDSGMAFVVIQHLDPRHSTLMPELLGRVTRMPVEQTRDRTPVQPDHIYVIPPNASLTIQMGVLHVTSPLVEGVPRMPIDTFFSSLAEDQGDNAVCILLSGSGSDGTLGLRMVKEHGGMVMAQASESAKHDSIPRSAVATGLVDYVLPAEQMPARLLEYVAHAKELRDKQGEQRLGEEAAPHLSRIFTLLRQRTGHDFSQYKQATLLRRLQRRMQVLQSPSMAAYVERLSQDPKEVERLFKNLLIGVTQFFRDPQAFHVLARKVIPSLLEEAGPQGSVRIWTPGCATGEEAYSLAILMSEEMSRRGTRPRVQIFAGDIDEDALELARHARYPEGIAAQVSPERLERFFVKQGHSYVLDKDVREMCVFSTHNLIKDPPFSRLDLIVCRNLLIYLEPEMQKRVSQLFHYALRPGGHLFLGPSENHIGAADQFRPLDKRHRIFRRNTDLVRMPIPFPLGEPSPAARISGGPPARPASSHARETASVQVLERILVQHYSPAWVVINDEGEVVYFSPRTGRYLEPPAGVPRTSILDMARKGLRLELRTALHGVLKTGQPVLREDVVVETGGEVQRINLVVRPLAELGEDSGLFMVVFQELGPPRSKEQGAAEGVVAAAGEPMVQQLESELRTTKEHLQAAIEELESTNEELTSSNEELQSSNEELQTSNEELQTSKEELQSVNEELETINAELNKKVEELDTARNDLENIFQSTQIATLFIDRGLSIKWFTPAATDVFRLIAGDVGRPIADIAPRFTGGDLTAEIEQVLRTLAPVQRQVFLADETGSYMMRILPYRRSDKVIDGVVVNFVDVTELTRAQARQAELAAIVDSSQDAIEGRTLEGIISFWNDAATRMLGYTPEEAVGRPVALTVSPDKQDELASLTGRVRQGEAVGPLETVRLTKDGRRLPVSVSVFPVKNAAGKLLGASAIIRDLSELARAKAALQNDLRQKDEFLAMLSHELRNPLAPLRTCIELLRAPDVSAERAARARAMMERQVGHLTDLVDQLLDVSRISSGKIVLHRQVIDLARQVQETVEDYRDSVESKGLALRVRLPAEPLWVEGDPMRLSQAVGNLLQNAAKFTDAGSIEVTLQRSGQGDTAVLEVRDTGVGIRSEMRGRLFQRFSQDDRSLDRSRGGLGLGLALTEWLLSAHGGTVEAESHGEGQGSEFTIRLPLVPPPEATAKEPAPKKDATAKADGSLRILLVEDNEDAAESIRYLLELTGHEVAMAADGPAALKAARSFKPEVVLCDIGLPGDMDGYQLAGAFRADAALREAYLIAVTGYGSQQDKARAREAGFDLHLRKPVEPAALKQLLWDLPRRRQRPPSAPDTTGR